MQHPPKIYVFIESFVTLLIFQSLYNHDKYIIEHI